MQFDDKARENVEAADRLLPDEEGVNDCLPNAVANRAYYAAYHAVAHVAQRRQIRFTSSTNDYYRHDTLPDDATRYGILDDDGRTNLNYLRGMRVKADYSDDPVEHDEADEAAKVARAFVKELIG
jgi:uncharacterized protein (UPF0332 family)